MSDHLKKELSKVLDEYDARRRTDEARVRKAKDDDARFLAQFAELRRAVLRPVFEAAGEILAARGHRFSIAEEEFSVGSGGKVTEAAISLVVAPAGTDVSARDGDHARTFSVSTRHYNKSIWINAGAAMNVGGIAGSKGAYPLERIDERFIEEELVRFVSGVVA